MNALRIEFQPKGKSPVVVAVETEPKALAYCVMAIHGMFPAAPAGRDLAFFMNETRIVKPELGTIIPVGTTLRVREE